MYTFILQDNLYKYKYFFKLLVRYRYMDKKTINTIGFKLN